MWITEVESLRVSLAERTAERMPATMKPQPRVLLRALVTHRDPIAKACFFVLIAVIQHPLVLHGRVVEGLVGLALAGFAFYASGHQPLLSVAVAVLAFFVLHHDTAMLGPVLVALYAVGLHYRWGVSVLIGAAAGVLSTLAVAAGGHQELITEGRLQGAFTINGAQCLCAAVVGLYVSSRRRVLETLRERAARLERERDLLADRAVADERLRIAQELHDIVAHNVSLMVVEARALGVTSEEADTQRTAQSIEELGRRAMNQMHTTVHLLRTANDEATPSFDPQPGLEQLDELVGQSRAAGVAVDLSVSGEPRPLSQAVSLSAFRILQEALTNVLRHTTDPRARVEIVYEPQTIRLLIENLDSAVSERPVVESGGHGLIGMRERASMLGGKFSAEPLPSGFRVVVSLPYVPEVTR